MVQSPAHCIRVLIAASLFWLTQSSLPADEPQAGLAPDSAVVVQLQDGRTLFGQVHPRSNRRQLWIYSILEGVRLESGYDWNDIAQVREATAGEVDIPEVQLIELGQGEQTHVQPVNLAPSPARVQSLEIHARLANWDADEAADGLLIEVIARSASGIPLPVDGSLDLHLIAEVRPATPSDRRPMRPGTRELERTTVRVRAEQFSGGRAVVQFPFNRIHPEADWQIATHGVVHARLGISGQGVFEASDHYVRLREFSPTRDRLQLFHGSRSSELW